MTGMSRAAWTIAQAIRCVNDSFLPAALSALRRASRASTGTVRKLVAVGIDRLSFMNFTSVAAGPRMGSTALRRRAIALDGGKHVFLGHPAARPGAGDPVHIESVSAGDAGGDGRRHCRHCSRTLRPRASPP